MERPSSASNSIKSEIIITYLYQDVSRTFPPALHLPSHFLAQSNLPSQYWNYALTKADMDDSTGA